MVSTPLFVSSFPPAPLHTKSKDPLPLGFHEVFSGVLAQDNMHGKLMLGVLKAVGTQRAAQMWAQEGLAWTSFVANDQVEEFAKKSVS